MQSHAIEVMSLCVHQVVNGMGGVGKSALSEKYATEWQKMYKDGVFHFNAESLAALHNSIRRNVRMQETVGFLLLSSICGLYSAVMFCVPKV